MWLKREYVPNSNPPVLSGIRVLKAGAHQKFPTKVVHQAINDGWMTVGPRKIFMHTDPELVYVIVKHPGYYCCHCNARLADSEDAKMHVQKEHKGEPSPDKENPHGFKRTHFYDCVKE